MARTPKVVEDRREQILDAAMQTFAEKGFIRSTNRDIAHVAGITPGLIYHYFESKEAVLKALIEERSPLKLFHPGSASQLLEQPPEILLPFLIRQALAIVESEQFVKLIRVFLPEVVHNPTISPIGLNVLTQVFEHLTGYFSERIRRGELRPIDPSLTAQTMVGTLVGFVFRRQILRDPLALQYSHEELTQFVADTILQGILLQLTSSSQERNSHHPGSDETPAV